MFGRLLSKPITYTNLSKDSKPRTQAEPFLYPVLDVIVQVAENIRKHTDSVLFCAQPTSIRGPAISISGLQRSRAVMSKFPYMDWSFKFELLTATQFLCGTE